MALFSIFRRAPVETKAADPVQPVAPSGIASPEAWFFDLMTSSSVQAGVSVTPQIAMRCAPVRCAVQAIAEAIGQLPVHVFARAADGSKERDASHSVYRLIHDDAAEFTSAAEFREQITRDALLHGNGLAWINRVDGRPVELIRLAPNAVQIDANAASEPTYTVTIASGGRVTYGAADILHIRAPGLDGIRGESVVLQAKQAIGLAIAMEGHAARLFGRGARPSGMLSAPGLNQSEARQRLAAAWNAAHGGEKSGGTAIVDKETVFTPLTMSSVDAQFQELRAFQIQEIARAFRVPPVFLMDYGRATWGNSEEMGRQFLTYTLMPWIKRWEGEIRLKLFTREERDTFFAEFLVDDLLRADLSARMSAYATAIAARVINPNEARAAENRPPYAGGDAFVNPNTTAAPAADAGAGNA